MRNRIGLKKLDSASKRNIGNKIVDYSSRMSNHEISIDSFEAISNRVVLNFFIAFLYLFSALEEIDWNIFSASKSNNQVVIDESFWNIEKLANLLIHSNPISRIKLFCRQ
tara:strand:- start:210 stop:539 length:330 start_codon:yes stop_codon:yes gene_type:complete